MKYGMEKIICKWRSSTLFVDKSGQLYLEKYELDYEKPLFAAVSKEEAAQHISTEKYDFEQEELLYLAEYNLLPEVLKQFNIKFGR